MNKLNGFIIPVKYRNPGMIISMLFIALFFSATLSAQVKQAEPERKPIPARQQPPQQPKYQQQENNAPRAVPVKPVQQQPRIVKPEKAVSNPRQENYEPKAAPVKPRAVQPAQANPVQQEPRPVKIPAKVTQEP